MATGKGTLLATAANIAPFLFINWTPYRFWEKELGRNDFTYGQFGENFTVEGLPDREVCIGDRYRIRNALFEVTQPARHLLSCRHPHERAADGRTPG